MLTIVIFLHHFCTDLPVHIGSCLQSQNLYVLLTIDSVQSHHHNARPSAMIRRGWQDNKWRGMPMSTYSTQKTIFRAALAVSASFGALCVGAPVFAQAAAAADEAADTDIVVTAQFRDQKLQDVPIAITAIDSALLESRSQTNLTEVANQAPSVTLRPSTPAFGPAISATIRGLGQIDFNPAYEPGVGIYVDDVYYPRLTGANFDLLDVERVEILRGPQGTLTGRNSEGGAIKFVSKKPTGEGGYVSATYGSRNRINLRASADFTIAKDLFARVSGAFADQGGYVKNIDYGCAFPASGVPSKSGGTKCVNGSDGDVGYKALRGIVRYAPSDNIEAMISADYAKDSRRSAAEVLLFSANANPNVRTSNGIPLDSRFVCGRYCNYSSTGQPAATFTAGLIPPLQGFPFAATGSDNRSEYEGYGFSGNININLSDSLKLASITAYRAFKSNFSNDTDLSPANVGYGINKLDNDFFSQELRLNAKLSDALDFTLGGYYSSEKSTYYTLQDIRYVALYPPTTPVILPIFPLQFIGNDPVRTKSKAVFGTAIFKPVEALTLTVGARYTHESKTYTFFRYNLDGRTINGFLDPVGAGYGIGYVGADTRNLIAEVGSGVPFSLSTTDIVTALSGRKAPYSGNRFDYRVSVDYRFSPEVLAYVTTSTGYKGGGIGPRPFNAAQAIAFNPEKLTAYEIGLKTDFLDRKVRLNLAAYFNKFKDAQLTLLSCPQFGGPGPCALPQNAGDADVKGFEAEILIKPTEGFTIDGSFSVLDWKWKCASIQVVRALNPGEVNSCSSAPAIRGQLTTPPRGVAKTQWSLGTQYEIDLGGSGSLTPRIDVSHQGKIVGGATKATAISASGQFGDTPSFTVTNARLTWRNEDKDLDISAEVSNLFDKYYFLSKFDLTGAGAGTISGLPARPREWAVSVKKKF
jgi:iron complex outermembrane recepter protein